MKVLFVLGCVVISTIAVRLPAGSSGSGLRVMQSLYQDGSGSYSPVTLVVVPRQAAPYYPKVNPANGLENTFAPLYQEESASRKLTPSVKTKRVVKSDERLKNPYVIPRRKLNYRQAENTQAQFLKEVTPTTITTFEERQQDAPAYRVAEEPTLSEAEEEKEVIENKEGQINQPEINEQSRLPLIDVQNIGQMRPIIFVQPDFATMQFLQQQAQFQEGLLNAQPQGNNLAVSNFVKLNTARLPKSSEGPKKASKKNQKPQVFPRVNGDNEDTVNKSVTIQPRVVPVARQANNHVQSPRAQFANYYYRNVQPQTNNKKYSQSIRQLPQIIKEFPFRYKLQLEQYNEKQEPQALQYPAYFNQAQLQQDIAEQNADVEENKQAEAPTKPLTKLNKRKSQPVKTIQERGSDKNTNARFNYHSQLFYPSYKYRLYPYTTYQLVHKDKKKHVLQNEQEEEQEEEEQEQEQEDEEEEEDEQQSEEEEEEEQ